MTTEETQLEKATTQVPSVITTPAQYLAAMERWGKSYNVLTPFTNVSGIAPSFGIIASVVKVNTETAAGEAYGGLPFLKGEKGKPSEELALAKIGLRKIAECGGISTSTQRVDPMTIRNYWSFKAIATYRGLDGSTITREATAEWDLRDGSDRLKGWTPNQIAEGRKNGLRNCEARATNAAIRECGCGIKQKYTRAELERPFLVVRVAFQPDMNDPAIKQEVTRRALEGTAALYAPSSAPVPMEGEVLEPVHEDPRSVGRGSTAAAQTSGPAASSAPAVDPDQPPVEGAVRIVKVESKPGETNGRKWVRFTIIDHLGAEHSTFDKKLAEGAEKFIADKTWVELGEEGNGQYTNLVEIMPAGQSPTLPGLDGL